MKIVELTGETFCSSGDCWDLDRTNNPTSARHGDGLGYIRIWATPPKRLVFWDGASSPTDWSTNVLLYSLEKKNRFFGYLCKG